MSFVNLLNKTNLNLKFLILHNKKTIATSNVFKKNDYEYVNIPDNITEFTLKIKYESEKKEWLTFISINLRKTSNDLCFQVSGDLFNASINPILDCKYSNIKSSTTIKDENSVDFPNSNDNIEIIKVKNNELLPTRVYISYIINNSKVTQEDIVTILPLQTKSIIVPKLISKIYLEFQFTIIEGEWKVIDKYYSETLKEKEFTIKYNIKSNKNITEKPSSIVPPSNTSTIVPPSNNSSIAPTSNNGSLKFKTNSYIRIENSSKFIVKATLQYGITGEAKPRFNTILITIGRTDNLIIPSNASLIYITIESKGGIQILKDFYMSPENHCFKITGKEDSYKINEVHCNPALNTFMSII